MSVTKTPWATDEEADHESVLGADGVLVADCAIFTRGRDRDPKINQANAAFIVRACNSHDALVKELGGMLDYIVANEILPERSPRLKGAFAALRLAKGDQA